MGVAIINRVPRWLFAVIALYLGSISLFGSVRSDLADTVMAEWRLGPVMVVACLPLYFYFEQWHRHLITLKEMSVRERDLMVQLQTSTTRQLQERMEAIYRLSGKLVHEYNNIFAGILPLSEMLHEGVSDLDQKQDARDIIELCSRAKRLNLQLVNLTKTPSVLRHRLELKEIFERWIKQRQEEGHSTLSFSMECQDPCFISSQAKDIEELLSILVDNAIEAVPPNGRIHVSLAVERIGDLVAVIRVQDWGRGIDSEILPQIFDPFVSTKPEQLSGLGLSLAYMIALRAGGNIQVESALGEGSTFTVYLPLLAGSSQPRLEPILSPTVGLNDQKIPDRIQGMKILLIDDEVIILRSLEKHLTRMGFIVTSFSDPERALSHLKSASMEIDLVITDIKMPRLTGPQLIEEARLYLDSMPPHLFLTGYIDDTLVHTLRLEEKQLLLKPFSHTHLLHRILELV